MAAQNGTRKRAASTLHKIEVDPSHHLTGPFLPQTPLGSDVELQSTTKRQGAAKRKPSPPPIPDEFYQSKGLWKDLTTLRWMRVPSSSFKILIIPIILYFNWKLLNLHENNPFEPFLFISHLVPQQPDSDPRYAKGWKDLLFIAYHIIFFSFVRQFMILRLIIPAARRLGIKKQAKLDRFGEQGYSMLYYGVMGFWGLTIMKTLPTWWYRTEFYWIGYPHWDLPPQLKRYYLMHLSYWLQQLIILALKIEKPRKDYQELVAHHIVTIWLIGWSYLVNLTLIGNGVFVSMDIPDTFLAFSKLCNYLQLEKTKIVAFVFFVGVWTYFRHWLNLVILWSVWNQSELVPLSAQVFDPLRGVWMAWWIKYQIFLPILLLQFLNLFWYFLILRILFRAIAGGGADDDRSDDEGDD